MKVDVKKILIFSLVILLSGCATTIPNGMVDVLNFFYNCVLTIGYLLMLSIFLKFEYRLVSFFVGLMIVLAMLMTIVLMNAYTEPNYFKISLPYFWISK